jgi:hypothetical protein
MTGQPLLAIILMTLGLSQLLEGITTLIFGVQPRSNFPTPYSPFDTLKIPFPGVFMNQIVINRSLLLAFGVAILAAISSPVLQIHPHRPINAGDRGRSRAGAQRCIHVRASWPLVGHRGHDCDRGRRAAGDDLRCQHLALRWR